MCIISLKSDLSMSAATASLMGVFSNSLAAWRAKLSEASLNSLKLVL